MQRALLPAEPSQEKDDVPRHEQGGPREPPDFILGSSWLTPACLPQEPGCAESGPRKEEVVSGKHSMWESPRGRDRVHRVLQPQLESWPLRACMPKNSPSSNLQLRPSWDVSH